jgi:hypothetical protein
MHKLGCLCVLCLFVANSEFQRVAGRIQPAGRSQRKS